LGVPRIGGGRWGGGVDGPAGAGNSKGGLGQAEQQLLSDEEDDAEDSSSGNGHTPSYGAGAVAANGAPSSTAVTNNGGAANGDLQAHLDALDAVVRRTEAAAPNQGELWCATAKETRNRRLPAGAVLRLVAERILGYPPALHPPSSANAAGSNHKADPLAQQS
jgi:hypothetical protein